MLTRRHFLKSMGGLGALGASTTAYGFSAPVVRLRVVRYNISPPQWPAGLKLRIAAIADLHACDPWMSLDHIGEIVERTNTLKPDIVVMLGDYVAGHRKVTRFIPDAEWAGALAGLKAPLGVHAVLGNHDWWEDKEVQRNGQGLPSAGRALEAVGIPVYENDAKKLTKNGQSFWLAGLGDQLAYIPARRFRPLKRIGVDDLGATLAKITDDAPVVLMAHEPDIARRVPARVALQLSGHTHGGQVRMLGWSPISPSGQQLAYGHIKMNCDVVVSGGLGCSIMPFRLGVPPEIVLVTVGAGRPAVA
ncbi:putative MPP superfamily phosphohydrolase [Bradyrhizobium sp. AZCC 1588]|uniref:metallophosphoesterase n=1 Tax=unclassified Bradyrhizobium TaxID=2631580 RepID=UPI002FEFA2EC